MAIKLFIQGQDDKKLFGIIGAIISDLETHKKLGTAITSRPGDLWWIDEKKHGIALLQGRKLQTGLHLRYLITDDKNSAALVSTAIEYAETLNIGKICTNDLPTRQVWKDFGFEFNPRIKGNFGRWEKELKVKK